VKKGKEKEEREKGKGTRRVGRERKWVQKRFKSI